MRRQVLNSRNSASWQELGITKSAIAQFVDGKLEKDVFIELVVQTVLALGVVFLYRPWPSLLL